MPSQPGNIGVVSSRPERPPARRSRSWITQRLFRKTISYAQRRHGYVSTVTVTTNLAGTVYYYWYMDGVWVARTTSNSYSFVPAPGEQVRIDCIPSHDAGFDYLANAPDVPAARVTLWWIRSTDTDIKEYKVEQQKDGGSWSTVATVPYQAGAWDYRITSPRLDDLGSYAWRVKSVDTAGNEGAAVSLTARTVVRIPDAPDWGYAFNEGTTKVTFSEAA
jgi:hypothetical protein